MNARTLALASVLFVSLLAACSGGPSTTVDVSPGPDTVQDGRGGDLEPVDAEPIDVEETMDLPRTLDADIAPDPGAELPMCPDGEPCDDEDPCTEGDVCQGGICAGTTYECDDGKECTEDGCDGEGGCEFTLLGGRCLIDGVCYDEGDPDPDNTCLECMTAADPYAFTADDTNVCMDGDPCTVGDHCDAGECMPSADALECDDGNPCTEDKCSLEAGGCYAVYTDAACDDGDPCSLEDFCFEGVCQAGAGVLDCDDGNPCTDDSCNPVTGCVHGNNDDACEDGDACTLGDTCGGGVCQPGAGTPACGDGNVCTQDYCDPLSGCVHEAAAGACNDGDPCTVGDECDGGQCTAGPAALNCDDKDPCTTDSCDPLVPDGCVHENNTAPCEDGNECTEADTCQDGQCVGQPTDCDDGNPCTDDSCDPDVGCEYEDNGDACEDGDPCTLGDTCVGGDCLSGLGTLYCNDGNPCTNDACEPGEGCTFTNTVGLCEDGNTCTVGDYCSAGQCVSGANQCVCAADSDCADEEDGNFCNGTLVCLTESQDPLEWACVVDPGTVVVCDPSEDTVCVQSQCQPQTGACVLIPINTGGPCDDENPCTGPDLCSFGDCLPGPTICECQADEDCASQEDGNFCNGTLICDTGDVDPLEWSCVVGPGTVVVCDPSGNTTCLKSKCVPATGVCTMQPANQGGSCQDGDPCTGPDACDAGVCEAGPDLCACQVDDDCADLNPCQKYTCTNGECVGTPITEDVTFDGVDDDCDGFTDEDVYKYLQISVSFCAGALLDSQGADTSLQAVLGDPPLDGNRTQAPDGMTLTLGYTALYGLDW